MEPRLTAAQCLKVTLLCHQCETHPLSSPSRSNGAKDPRNEGYWYSWCSSVPYCKGFTWRYSYTADKPFLPPHHYAMEKGGGMNAPCLAKFCLHASPGHVSENYFIPDRRDATCTYLSCQECCQRLRAEDPSKAACRLSHHALPASDFRHDSERPIVPPYAITATNRRLDRHTIHIVFYTQDGEPPEEFDPAVTSFEQPWCPKMSSLIMTRLSYVAPHVDVSQFGLFDPLRQLWINRDTPFTAVSGETYYIRTSNVTRCIGLPDGVASSANPIPPFPTTPVKPKRVRSNSDEETHYSLSYRPFTPSSSRSPHNNHGIRRLPQFMPELDSFPLGHFARTPSSQTSNDGFTVAFSTPGRRLGYNNASLNIHHLWDPTPGRSKSGWPLKYVTHMEFAFDNIQDMQANDQLSEGFVRPIPVYFEQVCDPKKVQYDSTAFRNSQMIWKMVPKDVREAAHEAGESPTGEWERLEDFYVESSRIL